MLTNSFTTPGKIGDGTVYNVTPIRGGDAFLFVYDDMTFLLDSGFGFSAPDLYENIKSILMDRTLDYILLTHSHYDHCLGSGYLRTKFKDTKVVAFSYAARIMGKESARATMRRLDIAAANQKGITDTEDYTGLLSVDIAVEDGDILDLNGHKVHIVSLPGHTKDSIAYLFPDSKIMLGTETLGMYVKEDLVMPSFLVGYKMSLESIKKAMTYDLDYFVIPHWGSLERDEIKRFFDISYKSHIIGRDLIVNTYKRTNDRDEVIRAFELEFYTDEVKEVYPYAAFMENINIQVNLILREEGIIDANQ